jgi:hypothetical protein
MDTKKLRKSYMPLVPKLKSALEYVNEQLSDLPKSEFSFDSNLKKYPSIKRKMEADQLDEVENMSDLVRGRLFFSKRYQFPEVVDIIKKLFGKQVDKVEKKKEKKHGLEYSGIIHINLKIDGVNYEMQLMPEEYKPHQEVLHKIYEKLRDPKETEKMSETEKDFLCHNHNNIYKKLHNKAKLARE